MPNAIDTAIQTFPSLTDFAAALRVSPQVIVNWRTRGVPVARCADVERVSNCAVRRWDLRPTDWQQLWPELVKVKARIDAKQAA